MLRRTTRPRARCVLVLLVALATLCVAAPPTAAQDGSTPYPDSAFQALEYRLVGPFRGGRVSAVAGVEGHPGTYYMGSTGGGVWKTTDYGESWHNVSDMERTEPVETVEARAMGQEAGGARATEAGVVLGEDGTPETRKVRRGGDPFGSASVGAIAVAPSDPNVVWVGMGSACIRGNTSAGDGVYRSTDGGATWHHVGLPEAGQIGGLVVHPEDPDTAWVAALGHAFGPNAERGVFRTTDAGESWENVLWVSEEAGAADIVIDPTNPRVLYAATWEAVRLPWDMISGGPGSGLFKSSDGGDTWVELTDGLPEGIKGKIGVAVSPARPSRVWTLVEHAEEKGLYRSDDGGRTFRLVSDDGNLMQRPWYYTHVYADPRDPDTVYVLNVLMWKSTDGGKSFTPVRTPHGDNHDLWIDPDDPSVMVQGNDGGANVTTNGGRTWSTQANQPTAEMYRVSVDQQHPYWIYGGQQDNSTVAIPSRTADSSIQRHHWYTPGGCESGHVAIDPRDPEVTYAGCYGGTIERYDHDTGHGREVMAWPQLAVGQATRDLEYRFQWNAPIRISPHDPDVLVHTSNHVHRSTDGGQTWQVVSPDLTRDDDSKQGSAGGPLTKDATGVEVYGTIFAYEESPLEPGLLWAGSDDGLVHVSRDNAETWQDVTPPAMPAWATVNAIDPSRHDPGRAHAAVHRYRQDDFTPYVFRTDDYGATWRQLAGGGNGIPADHFVRVVREDPEVEGLLYAGTEFGMYVSFDDGASWQRFQLDLPVTPVTDLAVHRGDLVVATQGRSYWILDDLSPVRQMRRDLLATPAHLFAPRDAVLYPGGSGGRDGGRNPANGAWIFYHLAEDLSEEGAREVTIEVMDDAGEVLRTMSTQEEEPTAPNPFLRYFPEFASPAKLDAGRGLNRWVWDFRLPDPHLVDDALLWGGPSGPRVPPGVYRVRLTLAAAEDGGEATVQETDLRVLQDPRLEIPAPGPQQRFALSKAIWTSLSRSHHALDTVRDVREQVGALAERLDPDGDTEALQDAAEAAEEALSAVEDRLTQPKTRAIQDVLNFPPRLDNQLLFLLGVVESSEGAPTEASHTRYAELEEELETVLAALAAVLDGEVAAFNQQVADFGQGAVIVDDREWRQ